MSPAELVPRGEASSVSEQLLTHRAEMLTSAVEGGRRGQPGQPVAEAAMLELPFSLRNRHQ